VIVTKHFGGRSGVYLAKLPLKPTTELTHVATIDVDAFHRDDYADSVAITGGAVAPGGNHFVLRTYTTAYEWDAPDGDVVAALRSRAPRIVPLAPTRQGEAITYAADGRGLRTTSERLPAPVHLVVIDR
jgi:hypothetical protein